jgi:hypothetical protein
MRDSELDRLLKSAPLPQRGEEYWREFPERVARELRRAPATAPGAIRSSWWPRLAWGLGVATVCLLAGFWAGQHRRDTGAASGLLQNPKLIGEVLALFPNRVRAIVQDETGLRLELSEEADLPESPPLWVRFRQGARTRSFVTFSGQVVEVAGQKVTVLAEAKGGVLLVGDRFVWSTEEPGSLPDRLQVEAQALNSVAAK